MIAGTRPRLDQAEDGRHYGPPPGSAPVQKTSADHSKFISPVSRLFKPLWWRRVKTIGAICCRLRATLSDTARSGQAMRCMDRGNTDPLKPCQTENIARCKTAGRPSGAATRIGHFPRIYASSRVARRDLDFLGWVHSPRPHPLRAKSTQNPRDQKSRTQRREKNGDVTTRKLILSRMLYGTNP